MEINHIEIDKYLAYAGVIFSTGLIIYINVNIGRIPYLIAGILCLIFCLAWLFIRKNLSLSQSIFTDVYTPRTSRNVTFILTSLFFILLTISLISFYFRQSLYERPMEYFILTALMAGIVALEVFFARLDKLKYLALFQIMVLGLSLEWTQVVLFPSVVGIDPAWHMMFTSMIGEYGHILPGYTYSGIPLMHLETLTVSLFSGFDYKTAAMFAVGLIQVVCDAALLFLLGRFFLKNGLGEKVGLIGALILTVSNYHVMFGWWSIPNTLASIYVLLIVYYLMKINTRPFTVSSVLLTAFLMISVVLTHTVTATSISIVIFVLWVISSIYCFIRGPKVTSNDTLTLQNRFYLVTFVAFTFFMLVWWVFVADLAGTITRIIEFGPNMFFLNKPPGFLDYSLTIPLFEQLFTSLGYVLFFAFSLIGCFYLLSRRGNFYTFAFVVLGITMLAIGFFSLIVSIELLNTRWLYLSQVLLALPMAISLMLLVSRIKSSAARLFSVFVFIAVITFIMIMNPLANIDNTTLAPDANYRVAFTESEMSAAAFLGDRSTGNIISDFDYCTNPSSSIFSNYYGVNQSRLVSIDESLYHENFSRDGMTIIREEIALRPFRTSAGLYRLDYDPHTVLSSNHFDRMFDNGCVTAYV